MSIHQVEINELILNHTVFGTGGIVLYVLLEYEKISDVDDSSDIIPR